MKNGRRNRLPHLRERSTCCGGGAGGFARAVRVTRCGVSLLDHRAIGLADLAPSAIQVAAAAGKRRFGSFLLVHLNAPAGLLAHPQVAVLHLRAAGEDLLGPLVEGRVLLDAEIVAHEVERHVGHVADGRDVAGPVPRGLDAEVLGQDGDLARGCESAGLRNVHADVVDQPLGDQRLPLVRAVEQLAHGDGGGAVLPDLAEVGVVLGRERILEEEHVELLRVLAHLHGLVGGDALVHVVQQLHLVAQFLPADFEQLDRAANVSRRLEYRLVMQRFHRCRAPPPAAVAGHARDADLYADVAESLGHVALGAGYRVLVVGAFGVAVAGGGFAAFATGELIDGHAGLPALDVPQSLVDAAQRIVEHRAVLPVRAVVAGLPDVLDAVGGLAHQEGLQISLHRGLHQVGTLGEGGAAVAVEAVLVGRDLDHREAHARGLALDHADVPDFGHGHGAGGFGGLFLGFLFAGAGQAQKAGSPDGLQEISTSHMHNVYTHENTGKDACATNTRTQARMPVLPTNNGGRWGSPPEIRRRTSTPTAPR
ncbi:hypothetical protein SBA4_4210005 [Candidatus Sulfopaludibacter sp. SbA4]|nr:hypothetical protein SBA4_4210005 [Candidatus Sulfopaludibacter sp. SbA4]